MEDQNPFSQDSRQNQLRAPHQIGKTLKVTALPTYLLALTAILLLGAFFVWGFLGTVSDKVYYSGYNTAKASLQQLEHELTYCTITAPLTGAVSRIDATLYSAATPGVPLFYIVDTEHLKVCFDVLENELHKFGPGTKTLVYSVAYPAEAHEAYISAISPVVEKNGMVHMEATLQPHPNLMPGMTAIVTKAQ